MIRVEIYTKIGPEKYPIWITLQHDFVTKDRAKEFGEQFSSKGFKVLYFDITSKQIDL